VADLDWIRVAPLGRSIGLDMDVKSEVIAQFRQVAQEQNLQLAPLTDDLPLFDSGLDSLCFAIIVVRLETSLGVDPFSASDDARYPVTLGEFIGYYQNAAK
jgi:acyl carrier protein